MYLEIAKTLYETRKVNTTKYLKFYSDGQRTIIYSVNDRDSSVRIDKKSISVVNIAPLLMFTSHHLIPVINRISVGLNSSVGDHFSGHPEEIDNTVTLHQPTDMIFYICGYLSADIRGY